MRHNGAPDILWIVVGRGLCDVHASAAPVAAEDLRREISGVPSWNTRYSESLLIASKAEEVAKLPYRFPEERCRIRYTGGCLSGSSIQISCSALSGSGIRPVPECQFIRLRYGVEARRSVRAIRFAFLAVRLAQVTCIGRGGKTTVGNIGCCIMQHPLFCCRAGGRVVLQCGRRCQHMKSKAEVRRGVGGIRGSPAGFAVRLSAGGAAPVQAFPRSRFGTGALGFG